MPPVFDPAVLAVDPGPRADLLAVLAGALAATDPGAGVSRHLGGAGAFVSAGTARLPMPKGRIVVLALGKAAPAMARAALDVLAGAEVTGLVAAPGRADAVGPLEGVAAGHPLPDVGSERAGRRLLDLANGAGRGDLVLCLLSGGGSALAEVPAPGLTLDDLAAVNQALIRSGAPIDEVNTVRKHLSALKGGWLARAAAPARLVTLALSDVVGSAPDAIASGPTVPDPTTFADALAVLDRHRVSTPPAVLAVLREGAAGRRPETPKPGGLAAAHFAVVADGAAAARGAVAAAAARGIHARVASTDLEGEARLVGARLAAEAAGLPRGAMAVHAGETTVTLTGAGEGGRNQELALAAGLALEGEAGGVLVASLATDGVDGPTDAAGGIGDAGTAPRGRARGRDGRAALEAHDSLPYLTACGDLLRCGPTGTNVGDVMVVYRPERGRSEGGLG